MTVSLVRLPRSLRKDIVRRLPQHHTFKDMTGKRFGAKTVVGFAGFRGNFAAWLCRCKCGRLSIIRGAFLHKYHKDCHCRQSLSPAAKKLQGAYRSIISRCYDAQCEHYPPYGGAGVTVCKRWRESIEAFARDMGPRPSPDHVIVRRNRRGNYTPSNCSWELWAKARARRGQMLTCNGKTQDIASWAEQLGITAAAMRKRLNRCIEQSLPLSSAVAGPMQGRRLKHSGPDIRSYTRRS